MTRSQTHWKKPFAFSQRCSGHLLEIPQDEGLHSLPITTTLGPGREVARNTLLFPRVTARTRKDVRKSCFPPWAVVFCPNGRAFFVSVSSGGSGPNTLPWSCLQVQCIKTNFPCSRRRVCCSNVPAFLDNASAGLFQMLGNQL